MSERYKVVIADFIADELAPEIKILGELAEVVAFDATDESQLIGRIDDADAVMLYHNLSITQSTIKCLVNCKLIVRCGVGIDNVDYEFAASCNIPVANVPDYGSEEVADTAIGMMLTLARGIHLYNSRLQCDSGPWMYTQAVPLQRLRGRTFGIVGLGRIGSAAAIRAKAIGMDVAFYDPYINDGYDKALGIRRVESLDELLSQAYVLSLHCPLTEETRGLLNTHTIGRIQPGSILINTARGDIVDTCAIPEALASGHLAGVGLDVLVNEPPEYNDSLILAWKDPNHPAHDRLIINPHAAFYTEQGLAEIRNKASSACYRALTGQRLRNVVNGIIA